MSALHHLTVVRDFADYRRGDHIEDDAEIARILGGEMRHHVVKVAADAKVADTKASVPDEPKPAATPVASKGE
jgi:hypothetical protein